MERQRLLHILEVDELRDLAIRIARDVNDHAVAIGRSGKPMDRHNRKKLAERPVVEQRLENGKIANVLIPQRDLKLLYFLRHKAQTAMHVHDLLRKLPVNGLDLRFRFQVEQAEIERLLRFFLDLLAVMQALDSVAALQSLFHIEDVAHEFVIFFSHFDLEFRCRSLDGTERLHHEHGMMRDNRASPFAHDCGMRDAFGIAHVHNVPNDVVSIFLEGIIGGTVEIAARAIVIDAETSAHIKIAELVAQFSELRVIAGRFPHSALDRRDIWYLGSDMKMNKFEAMCQTGVFQYLACSNEIGRIEAELRVFAAARRPFTGPFGVQANANADVRFDADFF